MANILTREAARALDEADQGVDPHLVVNADIPVAPNLTNPCATTVLLGEGDARVMLPQVTQRPTLVCTSPPYWTALDYGAYRATSRLPWSRAQGADLSTFLREHGEIVARLSEICADDAVVAMELDDFRVPGTRTLLSLPDYFRDLLAVHGFSVREHIRLVRPVAAGRRSGTFIRMHGRPGSFYPDSMASALIIAFRGDPMARLRREGHDMPPLEVARMRSYLGNVWRTAPPQQSRPQGHPCPMDAGTVARIVALYSLPGDWVLDPYAGSGTTAREATALGRNAIAIEREPHFAEHIRAAMSTKPLPTGTPRVLVPSAQLWLSLPTMVEQATTAAFSTFSHRVAPSSRHRAIAARASAACGVALPPELVAILLRAERLYCDGAA